MRVCMHTCVYNECRHTPSLNLLNVMIPVAYNIVIKLVHIILLVIFSIKGLNHTYLFSLLLSLIFIYLYFYVYFIYLFFVLVK